MLILTSKGLYCPQGNFYIDPHAAVENAVVTHAHSDHARRGSQNYFCALSGVGLLKSRLGKNISVSGVEFNREFFLGDVKVSFHPAGHILGSAQVRLECNGEVWVASGDYKREFDPTCEPFEVVTCDTFVTEATFGTPGFRWNKSADLGREIFEWYEENSRAGFNSILFAYSLGKTQRVLGVLESLLQTPIYCHPAATDLIQCYRDQGIKLAPTVCLSTQNEPLKGQFILGPQSSLEKFSDVIGSDFKTAFASGWMARNHHSYDRGFLMSDHADWDDLVRTILETKAQRVFVQHRGEGALVRHLKGLGLKAYSADKLAPGSFPQNTQLSFFERNQL